MILGKGTKIWHPDTSYIADDLVVGDNSVIAAMVHIDRQVIIGNNVRIQGMVYIPPKTVIEDNCFIAPQVGFSNDKYPPSKNLQGVTVKHDAIVGFGANIVGGVTIGAHSLVGMGSVVTKDIPSLEVWYGNPARFIMSKAEYMEKKLG